MGFLKRKKIVSNSSPNILIPFYKKTGWKIFFIVLSLILVVAIALIAFVYASGSKIFENGIGGSAIIKTLTGKTPLKGESDDRFNILLMGMGGPNHPGGLLTDSMMVVSVQPSQNKVAMLSVPRDLLVPISGHSEDKINSAFADGYNDYLGSNCRKKSESACRDDALAAGANLSTETVSTILGIPIQYYIVIDFSGFEKIVDQLGGIDVNVDKAIYDPLFPDDAMKGYAPFKISAGLHHLDGKTALKYARSRETTSDFDRAARQQKVLSAAKDKAMALGFLGNPKKVLDAISTLGDSMRTNFAPAELRSLLDMASKLDTKNAISKVLTNGPDGELVDFNNGTYYLKTKSGNFKEIQAIEKNIFSEKINKESANVEIINGSKSTGSGLTLSKELESVDLASINVTGVSKASTKITKTVIYDYSAGKKKDTLKYLKELLSASVITKQKPANGMAEIGILLGENFKDS